MVDQVSNRDTRRRWTQQEAQEWYAGLPWLVGCNFIPSTAINQLEMWQAETFDPETIDRELNWARGIGLNAARVFLHDLVWSNDPAGFAARIESFLDIASRHSVGVILVLFDGVWDPSPRAGPQRPPKAHVHNSGWVQSPGAEALADPARQDELEAYVKGVVGHFRDDRRVLAWDLFNEPDNPNIGTYGRAELPNKADMAERLLRKTYRWARAMNPSQPLTAGIWLGWVVGEGVSPINRLMLDQSDVISFHSYFDSERVRKRIDELASHNRPLLLTEFLARGIGSRLESILPLARERRVGAFCWGLVSGKTKTIYPWDSWTRSYDSEPDPWFHDIFRQDGSAYREEEVALIRRLSR